MTENSLPLVLISLLSDFPLRPQLRQPILHRHQLAIKSYHSLRQRFWVLREIHHLMARRTHRKAQRPGLRLWPTHVAEGHILTPLL
jgi:hypothetical protein